MNIFGKRGSIESLLCPSLFLSELFLSKHSLELNKTLWEASLLSGESYGIISMLQFEDFHS